MSDKTTKIILLTGCVALFSLNLPLFYAKGKIKKLAKKMSGRKSTYSYSM